MSRVGLGVIFAAFALFAWHAALSPYLRDSGELTTAAFTLGVAHETGFTLFCLLGKLASFLPLGEVATRLSLLSAACGALTAWLAFRIVRRAALDGGASQSVAHVSGVGAAGLLVAGLTMWKASTVPEVYAPTAALLALVLHLLQLAAAGSAPAARVLALAGGLSLGLHAQVRILVGPACAVWALWRLRKGDRWPLLAPLGVALGAAVVAYLPLRAARDPAVNWADPRALSGVVHHLSAFRIRRAFADEIFRADAQAVRHHLARFLAQIEAQLGLPALLAALAGLAVLVARRKTRALGVMLAVVLAGDVAYAVWVNPMGVDDLQCGTPTALVIAVAVGAALVEGARRFGRAAPHAAFALAVLVCVPAVLDGLGAKRGLGPAAGAWSRAALAQPEPRALVLTTSDDLSAGFLYEQAVAGARPDLTALVRQQLWDAELVSARVRRGGDELRPVLEAARWSQRSEHERIQREEELLRGLVDRALPSRAVWWEPAADAPPLPIARVEPGVPLERLVHAGEEPLPPARPLAARAEALLTAGGRPPADPLVQKMLAQVLSNLGRLYLERGDGVRAAGLFEAALSVRPGDGAALTNLAVVRAARGDFAGAARLVDEALEREPERMVARLNSGRYRLQLGDLDGAERQLRIARAQDPKRAAPVVGLARVELARGHKPEAKKLLETARALEPQSPDVRALAEELK